MEMLDCLIFPRIISFNSRPQLAKFTDKVLIPQEDHSEVNFVGLIIGPRGSTLKSLEKDVSLFLCILHRHLLLRFFRLVPKLSSEVRGSLSAKSLFFTIGFCFRKGFSKRWQNGSDQIWAHAWRRWTVARLHQWCHSGNRRPSCGESKNYSVVEIIETKLFSLLGEWNHQSSNWWAGRHEWNA